MVYMSTETFRVIWCKMPCPRDAGRVSINQSCGDKLWWNQTSDPTMPLTASSQKVHDMVINTLPDI